MLYFHRIVLVLQVFFLKDLLRVEEAVGVSERMVQRFPDSPAAWTQRLVLHFQSLASADDVIACLNKALLNVPEKVGFLFFGLFLSGLPKLRLPASYTQWKPQKLLEIC